MMTKIIPMQSIRTSLASIADEVEAGGDFVVVRNSKPVFRITPLNPEDRFAETTSRKPLTLKEIRERLRSSEASPSITREDLDALIDEVHEDITRER